MEKCLIIFSRYPEPGTTKTRMIRVLGATGAANLQRQMTEHTLKQVQQLQESGSVEVEIHFTGGNYKLMSEWLGTNLTYYSQVAGDLGKRMESAFAQAFQKGKQKVVTIGIDCPDLNPSILKSAFEALQKQDLVLGAAEDGGYYLIGLNRLIPELFKNISWGSDRVLAQTEAIVQRLGLNIAYLPQLRDIDRPEDLSIWQKYQ
jgi:rSAM/selenodomain-associated transferase 1